MNLNFYNEQPMKCGLLLAQGAQRFGWDRYRRYQLGYRVPQPEQPVAEGGEEDDGALSESSTVAGSEDDEEGENLEGDDGEDEEGLEGEELGDDNQDSEDEGLGRRWPFY